MKNQRTRFWNLLACENNPILQVAKELEAAAWLIRTFAEKKAVPECGLSTPASSSKRWASQRRCSHPSLPVAHSWLDFTVERNDCEIHKTKLAVPRQLVSGRNGAGLRGHRKPLNSVKFCERPASVSGVLRLDGAMAAHFAALSRSKPAKPCQCG